MRKVVTIRSAPACGQETTLFDAYLSALSHDVRLTVAAAIGQATAREIAAARSHLILAKGRYLAHIQRHGCGG
jgi:hypothetical protein